MLRWIGILVAVSLSFWNVGCGSSKKKKSPQVPPVVTEPEQSESPAERDRAFELLAIQVQTIFEENCISCHRGNNPAAGLDFTVESVIVANAEDIADFILEGNLPQQESLTNEEVEIIRAWQQAGYPRPKVTPKPGNGGGSCEGKCGDGGKDPKDPKNPKDPNQNDPSQGKDGGKDDDKDDDDHRPKKKKLLKRLLRCISK